MTASYHEEEVLGKAYDSRLMRRILKYAAPYKGYIAISILLVLILAALRLLGPYLVRVAIDDHIKVGNLAGLTSVAIVYLGTLIVSFGVRYLQIYIMEYTGQRIMYDIRMQVFSHLQELSLSFFDKNPVGRLMTRVTTDVEVLNEMTTEGIVAIFGDLFMLVGIVVAMLLIDHRLALVTFTVLPLIFGVTWVFREKVREVYRIIRLKIARINAMLQENITGMREVQLFNREEKNFRKFDEVNREHMEAFLKSIFYYSVFFPAIEIVGAIAMALIVWYGGLQVLEGTITLGVVVAFIQYSERFFQPIRDLSEKYNIMQAAMASSERIFKLLDTEVSVKNPDRPKPLDRVRGDIEFRNVWFAYDSEDYVLRDVSFKVDRGERVAIVGATGAGKTSIISLMARFYDIQKGQILIDGIDIRDVDKRQLRKHMAVVLQDVFIFSGNIIDNIRLGNKEMTLEQVREAARYVNADKFIESLPNGYFEKVSERGSTLSVGQKQLLAFARALAYNPEILLVLDEATSSVDTETEVLIQEALKKLMRGRTSIIIAHRLSTIQNVDRIIVMHKGRVREVGTHQELLAKRGIYYKLYELQYKGQEVAV
ncbi:MAG: ABC transporter ATP-binding protein [bacterium]